MKELVKIRVRVYIVEFDVCLVAPLKAESGKYEKKQASAVRSVEPTHDHHCHLHHVLYRLFIV